MKRILVGGFEGFGRHRHNPAADVALPALDVRSEVDTVRLPVGFDDAWPTLAEAYNEDEHSAILLLGLGAHAGSLVKIETSARNFDMSVLFSDVHRKRRLGFIEPNSEWRRAATIDTVALRNGLEQEGICTRFSRDAGMYVCNHLLYQTLGSVNVPVGFIHLGRGMPDEHVVRTAHAAADALLGDTSLL